MEDSMQQTSATTTKKTVAWHRWFRRTNVHIAEFILMLIMTGALLGVLCGLLYSVFGLAYETGYGAQSLAMVAAAQVASLSIVAPVALWLYARTTGQETVQQELQRRTARTVFLTIWMLCVVVTLVSVAIATKAAGITSMLGLDGADGFAEAVVTAILPGVLSVLVLGFGLWAVVKKPNPKTSKVAIIVLGVVSIVLLITALTMAVVRKDADSSTGGEECTYTRYLDKECSYSDYSRDSSSRYNDYDYDSFNDSDNYLPGSTLY